QQLYPAVRDVRHASSYSGRRVASQYLRLLVPVIQFWIRGCDVRDYTHSHAHPRVPVYPRSALRRGENIMRKRKRDAQDILPPPVRAVAIAALAVLVLIPIAYTLLLSITPDTEIGTGGLIPSHWAFGNYIQMWSTVSLAQGLGNSLIIAGIASVIAVVLAVGAAYIITRFTFRGRRPYLYSLVGLQTVPSVMLLLPLFVLFASIQAALHFRLVGTYEAMIITYLTFALPFATWLMVSYLGSIPMDLEEA